MEVEFTSFHIDMHHLSPTANKSKNGHTHSLLLRQYTDNSDIRLS